MVQCCPSYLQSFVLASPSPELFLLLSWWLSLVKIGRSTLLYKYIMNTVIHIKMHLFPINWLCGHTAAEHSKSMNHVLGSTGTNPYDHRGLFCPKTDAFFLLTELQPTTIAAVREGLCCWSAFPSCQLHPALPAPFLLRVNSRRNKSCKTRPCMIVKSTETPGTKIASGRPTTFAVRSMCYPTNNLT